MGTAAELCTKGGAKVTEHMGIIEEFIGRYRREYDFYDQAARLVALQLEARLQAAGVRAMVTFRAKAVTKLEPKVRDRAARKAYASVERSCGPGHGRGAQSSG